MAQRPGDTRAGADYDAHLAQVRKIVMAWQAGKITVRDKQSQIARENERYYSGSQRGDTGQDITETPRMIDQAAYSLADRACIPIEAAQVALNLWRQAAWDSEHADDLPTSRRILAEGREAYEDVLRAAR